MAVTTKGVVKGTASYYQSLDGLLKDFYGPRIAETINNNNFALDRLEKRKDMKWSGRKVSFPVHTKRNTGVGFRDETGSLPSAGGQKYEIAEVTDVLFYGTVQLTGLALDAVLSDRGGFRRALDSEMQGMVNDSRNHFGRAVWGMPVDGTGDSENSLNCFLGRSATVGESSTPDIVRPLGYTNVDANGTTRYFRVGDAVSWGSAAEFKSGTLAGYGEVTAVNTSTKKITVAKKEAGDKDPVKDDWFVVGSNKTSGTFEFDNGLNGLGAITADFQDIASQKLQGIAITSAGDYSWRSFSEDHTGASSAFDASKIHSLVHNIQEVGQGSPSLLVTHYSMLLEYVQTMEDQARFSNDSLKGGYQTISFASDKVYDWVVDKYLSLIHI